MEIVENIHYPYWHDVLQLLAQKGWEVTCFVSVKQEDNRLYNSLDNSAFSFDAISNIGSNALAA